MTREEAIRRLGGILTEAVEFENSVCYVTEEDREPLEMAIKALEQEAVLDKIRAEIADLDDAEYEFEGYYKAITDALQIIDKHRTEGEEV